MKERITQEYMIKGKSTWDIDFNNHGSPLKHSLTHAHKWGASGRSKALNGFGWR